MRKLFLSPVYYHTYTVCTYFLYVLCVYTTNTPPRKTQRRQTEFFSFFTVVDTSSGSSAITIMGRRGEGSQASRGIYQQHN